MRIPGHRAISWRPHAARLLALLLLSGIFSGVALPTITAAQGTPAERSAQPSYAAHVAEASQRFRIPERWILAVMQVESAGRTRAVSSAGAMGLMQIMPETWAELSARHRLGRDPFDPRANILGGTAYLREMYDRFGSPGFLAAYNAGPVRYQQHLATGRPLPRETRVYMATLLPMIGLASQHNTVTDTALPPDWREAPLFVERSQRNSAADRMQDKRRSANDPPTPKARADNADAAQPGAVFVAQSRMEKSP
ncbi:transglycosylase SLT domain-containing protein [Mesorhizobium sp. NBSH29]|uniref:lytic transglycosylase domain-containing protein n=1 Tax=Mesorhizobium sp. NBSH29 TaxID=2654249 RepID=UPI0018967057|nr:lytic transglycosylase domain-containing protein [Mesorhizobium sp. NBSH29]QPC86412.1 transglycosylase SLT domain-containing protein [Mesorhizobium sp. NBSH29]